MTRAFSPLNRRQMIIGLSALPLLAGGAAAGTVSDVTGSAVTASNVKRIVSIGSSVTEIIVALGQASKLVAIDSTSATIEGAGGLPDVGYLRMLSAEGVLSQGPDLICATNDSGPPEVIDTLKQSGIPFALIPQLPSIEGILAKISLLGTLLDAEETARKVSDELKQKAQALATQVAGYDGRKPRVLFILNHAEDRLIAGGARTGAHTVIELAGGENVAAAMTGYKPVAVESLMDNQPDYIFMMTGGGLAPDPDKVFAHPAIANSPAAKNRALRLFDGAYLLGFGPRTIAAAGELATFIHQPAS